MSKRKWFGINEMFNKPSIERIDEQIQSFRPKKERDATKKAKQGEGLEDIDFILQGQYNALGFNNFYRTYINQTFQNELERLKYYREMSQYPEIADVIEDAAMESTQEDYEGKTIKLEIIDEELSSNVNISKNLHKEFNDLFYKKLKIKWQMWNLMYNYFVDGKVYFEHVINKNRPKQGIIGIKRLPCETMDFEYDPITGDTIAYYQYLSLKPRQKPPTVEDAQKDPNIIVFYPDQISLVHYGYQGETKREFLGYLEKVKQPYNNLRLLETSVVIYRMIRAPERFVFRIDTGNMPKDKAMKYVEKIKQKFSKKQTYDSTTGKMTHEPEIFNILENFFLPQCLRLVTEIETASGIKTLKEMIDDYNNGIKNEVYSVDQKSGKVIKGEVEWAGITRKNAEMVRVHFDNGKFVDCTPDHKFVMRDGSEVEAQYLIKDDSLMPLYSNINHKILRVEKLNIKEDTGCLTIKDPGDNHNFSLSCGIFVKNSADGRGSQVDTIGGNPSGFAELDDLYYFQRKMYKALKYPMSRVSSLQDRTEGDILFGSGQMGEITRDEIKWAKFLERQQTRFCWELLNMFLIHLDLKGLKKQYDIDEDKIRLTMTSPNQYRDHMKQGLLETNFNNYNSLANNEEFSKYYLQKRFLKWTDDEIEANSNGFKKDKELMPDDENGGGFGF